ncbi:MAG: HAD hydrolase family protein [Algisphaera sp.]
MPTYQNNQGPFDAVLCDVDGCLIDEAGGPLDLTHLTLIAQHNAHAKAQHDRPLVTVCTGRPLPFAECVCRIIANDILPCVCENGAWIYDPAQNGYLLDPAITPDHLDAVAALERWVLTQYGSQGVSCQPGKTASVSLYHADPHYLETLKPTLVAICEKNQWPFRISGTWNYINCDLTHVSKATGIKRWLALTGLNANRCAGIGDTQSDIAIAQSVQWFGVPANRDPAIDSHATHISKHEQIKAVIEMLELLSSNAH